MILEAFELGLNILVLYHIKEPYPIRSEIIFELLQILGHPKSYVSMLVDENLFLRFSCELWLHSVLTFKQT